MSRADKGADIVGVNWGSSNFRAYRIGADGSAIDEYAAPAGVAALDRRGMAALMDALVERWPGHGSIYASGMIGSNIGWPEVP
jgi:2-dehydro-3-deoxygalactonokinase